MVVRQIRNATLFIDYAGLKFLIDPVFAQKATYPPFPSLLRAEEYNPLVDLPVPIEEICHPDAVIITHLHRDHFDKEAALHLEKKITCICTKHRRSGNSHKIWFSGCQNSRQTHRFS